MDDLDQLILEAEQELENPKGIHVILDLISCNREKLNDEEYLVELIQTAALISGASILQTSHHKFEPQGVTAFCLLSESHISIHTWPEIGKAALDIYTCGKNTDPILAGNYIKDELEGFELSTYTLLRQ